MDPRKKAKLEAIEVLDKLGLDYLAKRMKKEVKEMSTDSDSDSKKIKKSS